MPGIIYRALSKTVYDFGGVAGSTAITYTVAKAIDVSQYREATALIRIHALSVSASSTPSFRIDIFAEAPTSEDPATDFVSPTASGSTNTVLLSNSLSAPILNVQAISSPAIGAFLRIKLVGHQPATAVTTFQVTLSIDIVAKS